MAINNIIYHPNVTKNWYENKHLHQSNNGEHNPLCKIDSVFCSKEMSDVSDLCEWHRLRMAQHVKCKCDCMEVDGCSGDAHGRGMFRDYYNLWDCPVYDAIGLYCCGKCQNTDGETHICGEMYVGDCCINKHINAIRIKYDDQENQEDEQDDNQEHK